MTITFSAQRRNGKGMGKGLKIADM